MYCILLDPIDDVPGTGSGPIPANGISPLLGGSEAEPASADLNASLPPINRTGSRKINNRRP
jgi:hypothetical protein